MPIDIRFDINELLKTTIGKIIVVVLFIILMIMAYMYYLAYKPFIIYLPVVTDGMGSEDAMSGTLVQDIDDIPRGVIRIGTWNNRKLAKAFVSFDLSRVHENDYIVDAKLRLAIDNGNNNFNTERFSRLLIEEVNIGKNLDKSDLIAGSDSIVDEVNLSQLIKQKYIEIDVINIVKILHRDNRNIITFTLWGEDKYPNDNNADILRFTFTRNRTYLALKFKPYENTFKVQVLNIIRLLKNAKVIE